MAKKIIVALSTHKSQQPTSRCTSYHFRLQFRRAWVRSPIEPNSSSAISHRLISLRYLSLIFYFFLITGQKLKIKNDNKKEKSMKDNTT